MRTTTLAAGLTLLLAGCGFDPAPTAPDDTGFPVPEPALDFPEPQFATAVTNSWATKAPLPAARYYGTGAALNGLIYVVGGTSKDTLSRTVYAYDPGTNSWGTRASLPSGRWAPSAGVINGVLYVAGGTDANFKLITSLFAYTLATNTWTTKAPMPVASACGAAGVIGGKFYLAGGLDLVARFSSSLGPHRCPVLARAQMPKLSPKILIAIALVGIRNLRRGTHSLRDVRKVDSRRAT
jgi:hypothetical protein